jgi:hypothetical protein
VGRFTLRRGCARREGFIEFCRLGKSKAYHQPFWGFAVAVLNIRIKGLTNEKCMNEFLKEYFSKLKHGIFFV